MVRKRRYQRAIHTVWQLATPSSCKWSIVCPAILPARYVPQGLTESRRGLLQSIPQLPRGPQCLAEQLLASSTAQALGMKSVCCVHYQKVRWAGNAYTTWASFHSHLDAQAVLNTFPSLAKWPASGQPDLQHHKSFHKIWCVSSYLLVLLGFTGLCAALVQAATE